MTTKKSGRDPASGSEESVSSNARPASSENVLYVDVKLFEYLSTSAAENRLRRGISEHEAREKIQLFLFWEARLLDARQYRDWLSLLTDDCIYWVPANPHGDDPRTDSSINFDDRRRIIDRITLIETGALHAQTPPSRTCRTVNNIEAWSRENGSIEVRSNIIISTYRRGRASSFTGWQEHRLVNIDNQWRIRTKIVNLLNCDEPQGNTTFIL